MLCMTQELDTAKGMSDLLSPTIAIITEDYEAFWCFVGFMRKAHHNFRLDEAAIRRQLKTVSRIIKFKDSHLHRHLQKLQANDCFFVYRMVVVLFRRELTFEQTMCLWEVMCADQAAVKIGIGKSAWSRSGPLPPMICCYMLLLLQFDGKHSSRALQVGKAEAQSPRLPSIRLLVVRLLRPRPMSSPRTPTSPTILSGNPSVVHQRPAINPALSAVSGGRAIPTPARSRCLALAANHLSVLILLKISRLLLMSEGRDLVSMGSSDVVEKSLKRSFDETSPSNPETSSSASDHSDPFTPRAYQREVYEIAMMRNTIAVLETDDGNTFIAVMLIKKIGDAMKSSGKKKLIIFLAPSVNLVNQQFKVIKENTGFQVGEYYGAKGVDEWRATHWMKELSEHDVLVMTPQILLDTLRKASLSLEEVCLLIFDECHLARGNHPYTRIMKEFYNEVGSKPKIFGMTTSLMPRVASSAIKWKNQMAELEIVLDSQIYTIEDRAEMEIYVPYAKETCRLYDQFQCPHIDLMNKLLEAAFSKYDTSLSRIQDSDENHYKNIEDKIEIVGKQLSNDHANIMFCLNDLGLICTYEAVKDYLENTSSTHENENCRDIPLERKHYFEEVLNIIRDSLQMDNSISLELNPDYQEAVKLGQISPKLLELLLIFQSFGESDEVVCLILVERIITAKVIHQLVKKVPAFSHFTVSYLPGSSTSVDSLAPKMQKEFLKSFHSGKANLLFTTYEVEEGFVVPNCSYMIRFDLPKTICSYIQSRGWAQQDNSYYIMMVQRGNVKQRDQMFDLIRGEHSMTDTDINRDPYGYTSKADEENNVYAVEATGAPVTTNSTINLIYNFCQKLPFDKYFLRKPEFHFSYSGGECQCSLTIPPNTAFQKIVGPLSWNCHSAKQNVCLESCKKLHQMTSLNDHLVPSTKATPVEHLAPKRRESAASAGTTKRKELHGTASIHALSGTWGKGTDYATFQAYKLNFSCSNEDVNYSGFILLLESKLDEDVGNIEVDLYSLSKMVKSYVSSCGLVQMDPEQIVKAKRFHEFFFNGMFGKLFVGSKETRKCLFHNGTELLWSSSYAYLLLPIDTSEVHDDEPWKINWKAIDSCSSGIEFLKHCPLSLHINKETVNTPLHKRHPVDMIEPDAIKLHCANGSFDSNSLSEKVVVAVHTGRIYAVLQVAHEMTAETPFEESAGSKKDSFKSHADYFYQKYGLVLKYPQQQLLQLKQSHNPHNLLVDFRDLGAKISQGGTITKKPADHAFMPPELLYILDVPTTVLRSCYLLPSLLHRLESLMLASQLRGEISYQANDVNIPIYLILEAITTLRCNENFSMERLELLGDSVLKYTTSCHLFLKYPKMNEGQLTSLRSRVICNSNLHRLGTDHKIQGYIRDCPFDPRRWVAPGQLTRFPEPCGCNVDSSEVPLDPKFQSEDPKVKHGKLCDRGHRWLISKTISDCIEALIGAYYIAGGLVGTLHLMKWFGFEVELMSSSVIEAINSASLHSIVPKTANEIASLESKIGYQFSIKGILLEAMTHHSCQEEGIQYSYERLEFLGDSVLDMLITQYLYHAHPNTDPGELTDLRTASVNNESFAQSVVRYNLEVHMQHCSSLLPTQLKEYADMFRGADVNTRLHEGSKGPKPLGDFMESIAGAVLLDTNLNVDEVWKIFKPLLSPIVTPDKLELPPFRELTELCDHLGYFIKEKSVPKEEMMHAEISLQLKDELLMGQGQDHSRKEAKGKAALQVLKKLEARGITFARVMRKRKEDPDCADNATDSQFNFDCKL
ncbi:hypothetical protein SAY86_009559 [Trapa natans]|uniref:Uncharacterized protein n=1 Tax=Trapa natans TaxID=22666 RepID=A0AAN7KYL0_TRANT|nr:hypothetical protein SAY86_009559 [Trapa natans]